jgi:hypothetical protein
LATPICTEGIPKAQECVSTLHMCMQTKII